MSEVTAPIMTDATGQSIDSKLNSLLGKMDNLAEAFQPNASGIVYSNTTSGLTGDDVQEAIDEMAADVSEINSALSQLDTSLLSLIGKVGLIKFDSERLTDVNVTPSTLRNNGTRMYIAAVPGSASHIPSVAASDKAGYCITFVWDANNYATQLYICQGENSIYHRFHNNSSWQSWVKI